MSRCCSKNKRFNYEKKVTLANDTSKREGKLAGQTSSKSDVSYFTIP